ncbi:SHOCT domain-containing protein [Lactiplantibacillus mudanjiangensis]|uniref:SHOCT domain-containing protein n=1 Tax=Lactiplantibacillus mudanjiangensis TaxID=1296538 RepID=A0A660E2Q0_9LACO|nr:SHOCT domain-containing protein [Lactiplantibacillus mudanjiangensis]VDG23711.1 hypothetical protein [Lactobacillus casei 12A] [Lactiplantibacillus mudanjiangensis]VDG29616.1 hypothetical protein [Lactobacillus casei 12A] [Lactiplantibacillus mudanjiangensis]
MEFDYADTRVQKAYLNELLKVINTLGIDDTQVMIALKGAYKEYLITTGDEVIIAKTGYMTGHTFGYNVFRMPYQNITSVTVNFHLRTGYFEVAGGGVQSSPKSYWAQDETSSAKAPNTITLSDKYLKDAFTDAANIINKYVALSHQQGIQPVAATDPAEEIRKYKQLADDGIISNEEFEAKKNQLLGL